MVRHTRHHITLEAASARSQDRGWTLIELLVVIAIIGVLLGMLTSFNPARLRKKAERIGCESNLKTLHTAFNLYLTEYGEWPQIPDQLADQEDSNESAYNKFWQDAVKPFGANADHWMCPTDKRERAQSLKKEDRDEYESTYVPTQFSPGDSTPKEWPQPWLLEKGDFHGEGPLMIMPSGQIVTEPWFNTRF
jgi:prepilin-type N-terminal cleavage/methylation domain-containing protein